MLDRLIESSGHSKENQRRGGFLLSTLLVVGAIFASGILWSLFAKDLDLNAGNFELSNIVAPVPVSSDEPPPPPAPKIEKTALQTTNLPTRQANIARVDESKFVPTGVSTVPNKSKARPIGDFITSNGPEVDPSAMSGAFNRNGDPRGSGLVNNSETSSSESSKVMEVPPPPPPVKKEIPKPPVAVKKSLGVVNGMAINLIKPNYSAAAKAMRLNGEVSVQVTIDEQGNITAANAVSGHPLLRQSAEQAARASKFKPTLLSNQPVKATGIIIYKFSMQ